MGLLKYPLVDETQIITVKQVYRKVYYVRYFDDFLIGIRGSKSLAADVREEISQFIKSDLQLELKYSDLYHAKSNKVRYLGFDIGVPNFKNTGFSKLKETIAFKKLRNRIKYKKKVIEDRWESFLDRLIRKKISNQTNKILSGVTNKIKANKITNDIIVEKILDILKVPTEKVIDKYKGFNTDINIKELAEKWGIEAKRYLKDNWLQDEDLSGIIGGQELIDAHKHVLECMSKVISNENLALMTKRNFRGLKDKNVRGFTLYRATHGLNQSFRPRVYVPQDSFVNRLRE